MYTIPNAIKATDMKSYQIRLGLMGASGTGKTWGALTFPNPVVIDIDGNLLAHKKREDLQVLPFNDYEWIKSWYKYGGEIVYPVRDALEKWLKDTAPKLEKDQTLILDSWTTLQTEFDKQTVMEPSRTKDGSIDEYAFWERKADYSERILSCLKTLKCHVVVTFHEQEPRADFNNKLLSKVEPLMQGRFVKKIGLFFTDFFQTFVTTEVDAATKQPINPKYWWRTRSTNELNLKTRMTDCPVNMEPHFKNFTYDK